MKAHTTLIRVANNAKGAKNIQTVPTRRRLRSTHTPAMQEQDQSYTDNGEKDNLSESVSLVRPIDVPKCQKEGGSRIILGEQSTDCDSSIRD